MAGRQSLASRGPNSIALTFDDGPDPVDTPKLLDLLREKNVKATFFVVGKRADQHPGNRAPRLGRKAISSPTTPGRIPIFSVFSRLRACGRRSNAAPKACAAFAAFVRDLFRSPVGLRHALLRPYLKDAGLEYISWTIRTRDTLTHEFRHSRPAHPEPGHQRRHHPSARSSARAGRSAMLEALPGVIDELERRGFRIRAGRPARRPRRARAPQPVASESAR